MDSPEQGSSNEFKLVALRLDTLHHDVSDMKIVLKELTGAITKLALIEERQVQVAMAMDRAFKQLEKLEARTTILEALAPTNSQTAKWVERAVWAALGLLGMYMAKKVGLIL